MNNRLRLPGFPPPEQQDIVKFHLMKSLPYTERMMIFILLLIAGFIIQVLTLKVWPGAVLLVLAVSLTLVRGYDSRARVKSFYPDSMWTEVGMDKIRQIEELDEKASRWDSDILDISNPAGFCMFLLAFLGLTFVNIVAFGSLRLRQAGIIFTVDVIILLFPMWFSGIRRILKQGNLRIKVDIIKQMEDFFRTVRKEGENFIPLLLLARDGTGKSIPVDCKFMITFDDMPDSFYGIQAQINLNIVQGTSYPYFYCVIAAKPGFGLLKRAEKMDAPKNITIECDVDDNAEVIVIRQRTTKTSGYHTKINDCRRILKKAVEETGIILSGRSW